MREAREQNWRRDILGEDMHLASMGRKVDIKTPHSNKINDQLKEKREKGVEFSCELDGSVTSRPMHADVMR